MPLDLRGAPPGPSSSPAPSPSPASAPFPGPSTSTAPFPASTAHPHSTHVPRPCGLAALGALRHLTRLDLLPMNQLTTSDLEPLGALAGSLQHLELFLVGASAWRVCFGVGVGVAWRVCVWGLNGVCYLPAPNECKAPLSVWRVVCGVGGGGRVGDGMMGCVGMCRAEKAVPRPLHPFSITSSPLSPLIHPASQDDPSTIYWHRRSDGYPAPDLAHAVPQPPGPFMLMQGRMAREYEYATRVYPAWRRLSAVGGPRGREGRGRQGRE